MFESPLQTPIKKQPNIPSLLSNGQMSKIEMKIGEDISKYLSIPIIRQLYIFNPLHPSYPYSADIYLPTKDTIVEVNGYHHYTEKGKEKELHKDRAISILGVKNEIKVNVKTPEKLVYGQLQGEEREEVKDIYDSYMKGKRFEVIEQVGNLPDVKPEIPTVLRNTTNYNTLVLKLNKLHNKNYQLT